MARQNDLETERELNMENKFELMKLGKARGAHRAYVTRTVTAASESVKNFNADKKKELLRFKEALTDKKATLRKLDEKFLDIMSEECERDKCIEEVDESENIMMAISEAILEIEEKLEAEATSRLATLENSLSSGSSTGKKAKAKLPKLELQTFDGKPQDWPEFWDAFSSTVDNDEDLPDAVKFQYLKKSLLEPARSVVSGFQMTGLNYRAAVELLQNRYAKPAVIRRAHINKLLKITAVPDERQIDRMRALHDKIETHYSGLKALHVDEETHASIVVPVLLEKISQAVRLNMVRGSNMDHLEWNVEEFLESLQKELQVRQ